MKADTLQSTIFAAAVTLLAAGSVLMLPAGTAHAESAGQETAGELLDDAVLTSRVKAAFFQDERVSALRINVTSNKGVVQLSGFANSVQEADRAVEITRTVPGVKSVMNDVLMK